jgi:hypothetical protein
MKYRAVLIEPEATRETKPQQLFGPTVEPLEQWATSTLRNSPDESIILIFETIERPVRQFTKTSDLSGSPSIDSRPVLKP